ncbi:replication initiator [Oryzihumus leptocrescens]|uniref:Replication initiation protein n=1 Tax=Oryzihumus leptocrescens TaxID=297536 RepID=A0A542ZF89_9MICO|nr:hypothetical protein FB474_0261 [Oryzihumus leptocrescens]
MTDTGRSSLVSSPSSFPGFGEEAGLDLSVPSARVAGEIAARLVSRDFREWSEQLARVGNCVNPIRLRGRSLTVDTRTGEVVGTYSSEHEHNNGVTLIRCGNRRASECPACSRIYAADMFHLIRTGVTGGKGVPDTVSENPLVFATVTAPSFGLVHGLRENGRRCRARSDNPRCEHGRPLSCMAIHAEGDAALGQPLCADCYDYESHIVWQWWAPELWRRFTITLRRLIAHALGVPATKLGDYATLQYAKVAEYQLRGLIHFHALARLDGPKTDEGFTPAPDLIGAARLAELIAEAAASVRFTAPPMFDGDRSRVLAFGSQVDSRPVRTSRRTDDPDQALSAEQVAGYLAKYSTKSATDTAATGNAHLRRIRATARDLGDAAHLHTAEATRGDVDAMAEAPYALLGKWVHMLGFRGHFASKSRRYSVTLGGLRRARRRAQALIQEAKAEGRPLDLTQLEADLMADDAEETTLVLGQWEFLGTGWATEGETVLATAAAARAREYAQFKAQTKKQ